MRKSIIPTPGAQAAARPAALTVREFLAQCLPLPTEGLLTLAMQAHDAVTRHILMQHVTSDDRARRRETLNRIIGEHKPGACSIDFGVLATLVAHCVQAAGDAPPDALTWHRLHRRYLPHVESWIRELTRVRAIDMHETLSSGPPCSGHFEALKALARGIRACSDINRATRERAERIVAEFFAPQLAVTPDSVMRGMRRPSKRTRT